MLSTKAKRLRKLEKSELNVNRVTGVPMFSSKGQKVIVTGRDGEDSDPL